MQPTPPQLSYVRPEVALLGARTICTDDGARIAAFTYAQGKDGKLPILMLHGNGGQHLSFGGVINIVAGKGYQVIALDSRGQGKSSRGSTPLSYELMAADAIVALDALGIEKVHVLGYSDGGIEALILARDYKTRIASITVLGANLTPEGVVEEADWDIAKDASVLSAWASYSWDSIDSSLLTPTPEEARTSSELLRLMLEEPHIDAASLAAISCPTTIVVGEFDCIRDDETVAIAKAIAGSRLVVIPNIGHSLPKGAPKAVARELIATIEAAR